MKTSRFFVLALSLGIALGPLAASVGVEWLWRDAPIYQMEVPGERLEFGLRNDGVVVWRKITNVTNSPAESPQVEMPVRGDSRFWTPGLQLTNIWMRTNYIRYLTNDAFRGVEANP